MLDYFISYTGKDIKYATWVAQLLEENGYTVTIQAWDFKPGDNFIVKINEALIKCEKLIVILSKAYMESKWCEAEWTSKLAEQIKFQERRIIPVRIEPVDLSGLIFPIVHIDIVDKTEIEAKNEILRGISNDCMRKSDGFPSYYNVQYKQIDIDYYVEKEQIIYIKHCKVKVLVDGKDRIHNRITWFADEIVEITSLMDGITIQKLDLRDTNLNYNIVFNRLLCKGEEVEFRIKATLSNINKHFENFFSTEIITPTDDLSINLNLSDKSVTKVYTQKIANSRMNVRTEEPTEEMFYSPYHWHIPSPEINFEYKIYW